ncbi:MAG TPA: GTP-binding protein [Burkholderiales bacterium]|nr:GTP-binding protein [Burkholderiales bacterium]
MQPLRITTAGSVDDGKSTLIGRLLYDARAVQVDQLAAVERASARRGAAELDLSLLTDGLEAEREQGITIDVAYRYFATPARKFILVDAPGHEQYTRNMATGASNADVLVLLVDVSKGLLAQTRRHFLLARLLGVRYAIAFVNKMDQAAYAEERFESVRAGLVAFAEQLDLQSLDVIPGCALKGDMVVERGEALAWYRGPTLLERLESLPAAAEEASAGPLRFPVQLVSRPQADAARGYMGRVESGHVLSGTEVIVLPSGRSTRVRRIVHHGAEREIAVAGDSVTLVLADDIDIARGELIADPRTPPREVRALELTLVWLGHEALRPGARYLVQQASRRVPARITQVESRLDVNSLRAAPAEGEIVMNDIVRVKLALQAPLYVDPYDQVRATGSMILIDEATNQTVAAGLVR